MRIIIIFLISISINAQNNFFAVSSLHRKGNMAYNCSNVSGTPSSNYVISSFTYSSTIDDTVINLYGRICYNLGLINVPILILMHQWGYDATSITDTTMQRFASYGYFVYAPGMRAQDGASGVRDASGREVYDIYDGLQYVINNYAVCPYRVSMVGYSAGGANAYAFISRFPDICNYAAVYYAISDFGHDNPDGWYYNCRPENVLDLDSLIGDNPTNLPGKYYARYFVESVNNFKNALYLYHSPIDNAVTVIHSQNINASRIYETYYTESTLYFHGLPEDNVNVRNAESDYVSRLNEYYNPNDKIDTLYIQGWVKTRDFEIRLGNLDDEAGKVNYNLNTETFEIIPLTGNMDVELLYFNYDSIFSITDTTIIDF